MALNIDTVSIHDLRAPAELMDAIHDRAAAASQIEGGSIDNAARRFVLRDRAAPQLDDLEQINAALYQLADVYLDLTPPQTWTGSGRPLTCIGAAALRAPGEDSLDELPSLFAQESAAALGVYREWLRRAWRWIGRFRYLDARVWCRFMERTSLNVTGQISSSSPEGGYPGETVFAHASFTETFEKDPDEPVEHTIQKEGYRYSDLRAINPTGRVARLLALPFEENQPLHQTVTNEPAADGSFVETCEDSFWQRGAVRPGTTWTKNGAAPQGNYVDWTENESIWHYSPDGNHRIQTTKTSSGRSRTDSRSFVRSYEKSDRDFDPFGTGLTFLEPVELATVPPHLELAVGGIFAGAGFREPDSWASRPDVSDFIEAESDYDQRAVYAFESWASVHLVFDFGPSFRHLPPA